MDVDALRKISYFAALATEDLQDIAAITVTRHYDRGEILLLEGTRGGGFYYLQSGLIRIFKTSPEGKELVLRLITPGHTFNDVPALDSGPNPASAAALEPSVVSIVSGADLRRLIAERPGIAQAVVRELAGALRHLVGLAEDLSFRHVTARVAKILLDQAERIDSGEATVAGRPTHRLTQQEIASMAGTAREMVGRALKELEAAGAISLDHGRIGIQDIERLRLLAGLGQQRASLSRE